MVFLMERCIEARFKLMDLTPANQYGWLDVVTRFSSPDLMIAEFLHACVSQRAGCVMYTMALYRIGRSQSWEVCVCV